MKLVLSIELILALCLIVINIDNMPLFLLVIAAMVGGFWTLALQLREND